MTTSTRKKVIRASNPTRRVWENSGGQTFAAPATGKLWQVPSQFIQRKGTPITCSLTGSGKRELVQRVDGAEWRKRLIAVLTLQEARIGLGYKKAVVFVGDRQFQPTYDDWRSAGMKPTEIKVLVGMDTPEKGRKDRTMAKKNKKAKKDKGSKGDQTFTNKKLEREVLSPKDAKKLSQTNGKRMCAYLIATTKKFKDADLREKVLEFCPSSATAKSDPKWNEMVRSVKAGELRWLTNVNVHKKGNETPTVKDKVQSVEMVTPKKSKSKSQKKTEKEIAVALKAKDNKDKKDKVAKKVVKKVVKKIAKDEE